MYTVQPQTVVILVLLGDVSPRKYLSICWDFKMSQSESSSNFMKKVISQLAVHNWEPHNPNCLTLCERGLETSIEKQLNSAFLISTKRSPFGFMFTPSDLTVPVDGHVNSSSSSFPWVSAWEWPLGLCLVSSRILLSGNSQ